MPSKSASTKSKNKSVAQRRQTAAHFSRAAGADVTTETGNGRGHQKPYRLNPETEEEREKRLTARKALTLKAARIAYENHHRRKAS
ncbi:MAG: hypothetical protein QOC96_735 [Acidobacteriota bacterium]|nr:hypothetical protein [Acidobacteriota bacterium]